jgi:tetratricopeptide (TPR) repeat protein
VAKKRSSKGETKRKASTAGPAGGGIMSLNKSHTSVSMKVIIVLLIVAFVSLFLYGGVQSIIDLFKNQSTSGVAAVNPVDAIKTKNQPAVAALSKIAESSPTSYTVLVSLGNAYFDWAQQLSQASQTSTAALAATAPLWNSAKSAYGRAVKIKPGEAAVTVDYSIATFYSGDTTAAIAIAEPVTRSQPTFVQAWLNLGVYYEAARQNAKAINAFEKYLVLDPTGKQGDSNYVKQQLAALKKSTPSTITTP